MSLVFQSVVDLELRHYPELIWTTQVVTEISGLQNFSNLTSAKNKIEQTNLENTLNKAYHDV